MNEKTSGRAGKGKNVIFTFTKNQDDKSRLEVSLLDKNVLQKSKNFKNFMLLKENK